MRHEAIARPKQLIVAHLLVLLADHPRHGYDLAEALRAWKFDGVSASLVYRELARLEDDDMVRSFWEASQARGPARHVYELTTAGHDELAACADDLRGLMAHLSDVLSLLGPAPCGPESPSVGAQGASNDGATHQGLWKLRRHRRPAT